MSPADAFLDGRLSVNQGEGGYRAGADPVLLAAAVAAKAGESVLELGCGVGVASLCLLARVPEVRVTAVEREAALAVLAQENMRRNGFEAEVMTADIDEMPEDLRARDFDHVMANPPFFDRTVGSRAKDALREAGRGAETAFETWVDVALRRLVPGGRLTMIFRADALPRFLAALEGRAGDITVLPLVPRPMRPAKLIIATARKGAGGPFCLAAPFVLHTGAAHSDDAGRYSPEADAILRGGEALPIIR